MAKESRGLIQVQAKPRAEKQITYFCRLCRNYNVKSRKAHLKNFHNADAETISKRVTDDIVDVLFLPNQ